MTLAAESVTLSFDAYAATDPVPGLPTLVIAHGLFGSSTNWRGISRRLSTHYRVLSVDMRNHGESPWSMRHDYAAMAADLGALIEQETDGPCVLVGHSMGGKAAMTLALTQPQRLTGVIIIDIAPVSYTHTHSAYISAMQGIDLNAIGSRAEADTMLAVTIPEAPIRQFLLQNLVRVESAYRWRINLDVLDQSMNDLTGFDWTDRRYAEPALFIYGTASGYVGKDAREASLLHFPNAKFDAVEGAGHWVHAEQPKKIIQSVDAFCRHIAAGE